MKQTTRVPTMFYISEDIVADILSRLPVKSILKFRSVSKSWRSLISDNQDLIRSHLKKNSSNNKRVIACLEESVNFRTGYFLSHKYLLRYCDHFFPDESRAFSRTETSFAQFPLCMIREYLQWICLVGASWLDEPASNCEVIKYEDIECQNIECQNDDWGLPHGRARLVGTYNGLCCLVNYYDFDYLIPGSQIFLCNPATRVKYKLPDLNDLVFVEGRDIQLIPSKKTRVAGFGFDEANNDYKVLAVGSFFHADKWFKTVKLYSSRTNCWETVNNYAGHNIDGDYGKFLNGKLHWVTWAKEHSVYAISTFDLHTKVFGLIEQPNYVGNDRHQLQSLALLNGCLAYIRNNSARKTMQVWVMKHYGIKESWQLLADIGNHHFDGEVILSECRPFHMLPEAMTAIYIMIILIISLLLLGILGGHTRPEDDHAIRHLYADLGHYTPPTDPCGPPAWDGVRCRMSEGILTIDSIDLSSWNISGSLPSTFPPHLATIELTHNLIERPWEALCSLDYLETLLIDHNNMSGPIPDVFDRLTHLTTLSMSDNYMTGPLPPSFGRMKNLSALHVQNNRLSGTLEVLENLTALIDLNIDNNSFSGGVPETVLHRDSFRCTGCPRTSSTKISSRKMIVVIAIIFVFVTLLVIAYQFLVWRTPRQDNQINPAIELVPM